MYYPVLTAQSGFSSPAELIMATYNPMQDAGGIADQGSVFLDCNGNAVDSPPGEGMYGNAAKMLGTFEIHKTWSKASIPIETWTTKSRKSYTGPDPSSMAHLGFQSEHDRANYEKYSPLVSLPQVQPQSSAFGPTSHNATHNVTELEFGVESNNVTNPADDRTSGGGATGDGGGHSPDYSDGASSFNNDSEDENDFSSDAEDDDSRLRPQTHLERAEDLKNKLNSVEYEPTYSSGSGKSFREFFSQFYTIFATYMCLTGAALKMKFCQCFEQEDERFYVMSISSQYPHYSIHQLGAHVSGYVSSESQTYFKNKLDLLYRREYENLPGFALKLKTYFMHAIPPDQFWTIFGSDLYENLQLHCFLEKIANPELARRIVARNIQTVDQAVNFSVEVVHSVEAGEIASDFSALHGQEPYSLDEELQLMHSTNPTGNAMNVQECKVLDNEEMLYALSTLPSSAKAKKRPALLEDDSAKGCGSDNGDTVSECAAECGSVRSVAKFGPSVRFGLSVPSAKSVLGAKSMSVASAKSMPGARSVSGYGSVSDSRSVSNATSVPRARSLPQVKSILKPRTTLNCDSDPETTATINSEGGMLDEADSVQALADKLERTLLLWAIDRPKKRPKRRSRFSPFTRLNRQKNRSRVEVCTILNKNGRPNQEGANKEKPRLLGYVDQANGYIADCKTQRPIERVHCNSLVSSDDSFFPHVEIPGLGRLNLDTGSSKSIVSLEQLPSTASLKHSPHLVLNTFGEEMMMNYEADIWLTNNPLALAAPDAGIKITALVAESGSSLLAYHDIAKLGIVIGRENVNSGGEKSLPIEQECDPLEVKKFSFAPDHTSQMEESCEFMTPANSVDLQKGITDKVQGEKHGQNLESVITLQEASVPDSEYSPQLNTCQAHEQSDNQQNQASCKSVLPTSQPGQPQAALLHELLRTTKEKECFSTSVLFCFISVLLCVILPLLFFIAPIDTTNQTEMLHQAIIGYNQSAESGKCKQPSCSAQIHGGNVKKCTNIEIESVVQLLNQDINLQDSYL